MQAIVGQLMIMALLLNSSFGQSPPPRLLRDGDKNLLLEAPQRREALEEERSKFQLLESNPVRGSDWKLRGTTANYVIELNEKKSLLRATPRPDSYLRPYEMSVASWMAWTKDALELNDWKSMTRSQRRELVPREAVYRYSRDVLIGYRFGDSKKKFPRINTMKRAGESDPLDTFLTLSFMNADLREVEKEEAQRIATLRKHLDAKTLEPLKRGTEKTLELAIGVSEQLLGSVDAAYDALPQQ